MTDLFEKKEPKIGTQLGNILNYLRGENKLTGKEALHLFDTMHLPRRILDLKEMGHDIKDEWVTVQSGKTVKRYYLEGA